MLHDTSSVLTACVYPVTAVAQTEHEHAHTLQTVTGKPTVYKINTFRVKMWMCDDEI